MKRARKKFKPLKITPGRGSGLSDVSENHDYYFALGPVPAPEVEQPNLT